MRLIYPYYNNKKKEKISWKLKPLVYIFYKYYNVLVVPNNIYLKIFIR